MAVPSAKSREEYLKRYLSSEVSEKKVKKKKIKKAAPVKKTVGLKIIDTDLDVRVENEDFEDEVGEEAPIIAGIIDERPIEAQFNSHKKYSQWEVDDSNEAKGQKDNANPNPMTNSDSDLSPERGKPSDMTVQNISASRRRHDSSDSDCSHEPRRDLQNENTSLSISSSSSHILQVKSAKINVDSDGDMSPPRAKNESKNSKRVVDSDGDLSPPRKKSQSTSLVDSDGDLSPPRKTSSIIEKDQYNILQKVKGNSVGDSSSERNKVASNTKSQSSKLNLPDKKIRPEMTLSGSKAGLQSAAFVRKEAKVLRKLQDKHFKQMSEEQSGHNAEVVHRDRATGKKRDLEAERQKNEEEKKKVEEKEAKYAEWGKGIEQRAEQLKRFQVDVEEMNKPLARYQDDEDLDRILKEQEREGDPMLEYMTKKKKKTQTGPIYPQYKGPTPPPNRFGIKPGYRWDGVDRSNGFEKRYFEKVNTTKSLETEAHLWSVQEM